ncbi:MAG: RHS repeat-associated core domain-containing protein [Pseudomonadota bacterium]
MFTRTFMRMSRTLVMFLGGAILIAPATSARAAQPKSFDSICLAAPTTRSPGPADLMPGRYFNTRRVGQGWDFFWYGNVPDGQGGEVPNRLFVVWYTHEYAAGVSGDVVPVWYGAVGETGTTWNANQPVFGWRGHLYRFRLTTTPRGNSQPGQDTFRQWLAGGPAVPGGSAEQVGTLELFFGGNGLAPGGRPNQVAARWALNNSHRVAPGQQIPSAPIDDCLTNYIVDGSGVTPVSSLTGVYMEDNSVGMFWTPVYWTRDAAQFEHHGFAYFDQSGHPRWLVGHPSQPAVSSHVCRTFATTWGSQWPSAWRARPSDVMCMTRVGFQRAANASVPYAPWDLDRPYYEAVTAAMLRQRDDNAAAPSADLGLLRLDHWLSMASVAGADGVARPPAIWVGDLATPSTTKMRKIIGLTRALLLDDAQNPPGGNTCRLELANTGTPGACRLRAHWMTEGSYLNLTLVLHRRDLQTGRTDQIEVSRGMMRSPAAGFAVPGGVGITGNVVAAGLLADERVSLRALEGPGSAVTIAATPEITSVLNPTAGCSLPGSPGTVPPLSSDPVVTLSGLANGALRASASYPQNAGSPFAMRFRLYDATTSPERYVGERSLAYGNAGSTAHHDFQGLTVGTRYRVRVDAYNQCDRRGAWSSGVVEVQLPQMADQDLGLAPPLVTGDPGVGTLPLQSGVSGGAATWSLPIEVPPGIQGVQPTLSVTYNSRSGNGIAGMGTSVSGLSSIHRCPATLATDGHPRAVDFSESDRLCLDGQRLIEIVISPGKPSLYGQAGTTYRTEIDQHLRVTQLGGSIGSPGAVVSFLVETRSGDVLHYGDVAADSAAATAWVAIPGGTQLHALTWNLRRRANRAGNFIEYRYAAHGSGERLLSTIRYTGTGSSEATGGVSGNREIRFVYESRPDPASSYLAGGRVDQTRRLQTIETNVASVVARRYSFTYGSASASSGRSLLRDVSLCVSTGETAAAVSECLPSTSLSWQEQPVPRSIRRLPLTDTAIPAQASISLLDLFATDRRDANGNPIPPKEFLEPLADFDGDGTLEYLYHFVIPNRPDTLRARLINLGADRSSTSVLSLDAPDAEHVLKSSAGDLNNDGRADLWVPTQLGDANRPCAGDDGCGLAVMQWRPGATWPVTRSGSPSLGTVFSREPLFFEVDPGSPSLPGFGIAVPIPKAANRRWFIDGTGDGLPDLFLVNWPTGLNDGTQTSCEPVQRYGVPNGPAVSGPEIRIYENRSADGVIRFAATPMARECLPRDKRQVGFDHPHFAWDVTDVSDLNGDGIPDIALRPDRGFPFASRDIRVKFGRSTPAGAGRATYDIGGALDFKDLFADRNAVNGTGAVAEDKVPTMDVARFVDVNGDGLRDIHAVGVCERGGQTYRHVDLVALNTGRAASRALFDRFVGPVGPGGIPFRYHECLEPGETVLPGPDFSVFADVDADGRDELLRPTGFVLRQCMFIFEGGPKPRQFWSCPENPRGVGQPPVDGGPLPPGRDPILDTMYQDGLSGWDRSLYYASATRLLVDTSATPPVLRTEVVPGALVTDAGGNRVLDLYGDGLADTLLNHNCPIAPIEGQEQCLVRFRARDGAGNPLVGSHGTYVGESRGVEGNPGDVRSVQRAPLLPDLLWQVRAAAPIGVPGAAAKVARWSFDPLSSRAGRTAPGELALYALPTARVAPANHFYFTSSMPVVAWFEESNGNVSRDSSVQRHGLIRRTYGYREALYSAEGRGLRGFRAIIEEVDGLSSSATPSVTPGLRTTTVYRQAYPLSSALECRFVNSVVDPVPALEDGSGYIACPSAAPSTGGTAPRLLSYTRGGTVPVLRQCASAPSPACYWDLQDRSSESRTFDPLSGRLVTEQTATATFDNYGNTLSSQTTSTQTDASGRTASQTERVNRTVIVTESPGWFVNRVSRETVEVQSAYTGYAFPTVPPGAQTRATTRFFDHDYDPATGRGTRDIDCVASYMGNVPTSSSCRTADAADPNWLHRRTVLSRDGVGNVASARITLRANSKSGNTATVSRNEFTDWGFGDGTTALDAGYFPRRVDNAQGHGVCTDHDRRFGTPKRITRLMNASQTCASPGGALVESVVHDGFGREVSRTAPQARDGGQDILLAQPTSVVRQWCTTGRCAIAPSALYREVRQQRGSAPTETYHDAAGRPIVSGVARFGADPSAGSVLRLNYSTATFDDLGRKIAEVGPSNAESSGPSTGFIYDRFGRLRVKVQDRERLDGGVGPGVQQRLVTAYNPDRATVGVTVEACTSSSLALTVDQAVAYQCSALPSYTGPTRLEMSRVMDAGGRPLETVDANRGSTRYVYDGAGNPLAIQDAAGVVTRASYDEAGRRRSVDDPNQGRSTFEYNGLGELVERADARGWVTVYNRDVLGRVLTRTWSEDGGLRLPGSRYHGIDRFDYDSAGFGLLVRESRTVFSSDRPDGIDPANPPASAPRESFLEREYAFDPLDRVRTTTTRMQNPGPQSATTPGSVAVTTVYDRNTGRVKQRTWPQGVSVGMEYTPLGYLRRERVPESTIYREVMGHDAFGNEVDVRLADGALRRRQYTEGRSGYTTGVCYQPGVAWTTCAPGALVNVGYAYDAFGNVSRQTQAGAHPGGSGAVVESFGYDLLHRMVSASGAVNATYSYSSTGNILKKSDFSAANDSAYAYGNVERKSIDLAGPNAVRSVQLAVGGSMQYRYDRSGNMIARDCPNCGAGNGRSFQWIDYTVDHLPKRMQAVTGLPASVGAYPPAGDPGLATDFWYGPDGQRYAQFIKMGNPSRTTIYVGEYERDEVIGSTSPYIEHRYAVAPGVLVVRRESGSAGGTPAQRSGTYYVLRDRLGSSTNVIKVDGTVIAPEANEQHGFGPFGEPRTADWTNPPNRTFYPLGDNEDLLDPAITRRGFTQHEHLDRHSLIHMNGRLYDYLLGRFLGVDPIIQFPTNSQSLNPYSYILNNPLSGTDPTGYASCDVGADKSCLEDGVNTVTKDGKTVGTVIVGNAGDELTFSGGGASVSGVIGKGGNGASFLGGLAKDPSAIGGIASRINGSFEARAATLAANDVGPARVSRLGGGPVLAEAERSGFGDSFGSDLYRNAGDFFFGGPVYTDGRGSTESWGEIPLPQVKAAGGVAVAGTLLLGAIRRAVTPNASNFHALFLRARPDLPSGWHVHHSLPQRYEELLRTAGINIHEVQFLRGVSPQVHSRITAEWARFHTRMGRDPTAAQIADFAKRIDDDFGHHFVWPGY